MREPLDYANPSATLRGSWYTRVPIVVLILILLLPPLAFSHGGRTLPGERWTFMQVFGPVIGCPIVLTFAILSYATSSQRRRIALLILIALAILGMWELTLQGLQHW